MKDSIVNKILKDLEPEVDSNINEETVSANTGVFANLLTPLLYRVYTQSLVSQIADIQPTKTPYGKVFALISTHGGRDYDNLSSSNSIIITLSDIGSFVVDGTITTATGAGVIVYAEEKSVLVKITSGYFTMGQATVENPSSTITMLTSNRNYAKKVFANYSGPYTTAVGEAKHDVSNIDFEIVDVTIEVVTRKLKSRISHEVVQDVKAMFGHDLADDLLVEEIASEMIQEIDQEIIRFLKSKASILPDVVLANSYGTANDLASVGNDIYINIYKASQQIMVETKRRHSFFVIADVRTLAVLMTNPLHTKPESDESNSYYMGKVGNLYSLYLDPYATESYCMIGYKSTDKDMGDAGLLFAPYSNMITPTVEYETGKSVIYNIVRYAYTLHPQDTAKDTVDGNDSIFFKMFNVNTSGLVNFPL